MANLIHSEQTVSEGIHIIQAFEYADAAARTGATGLTAADIGKVSIQLDNNSFWILSNNSPVTWGSVDGGGGSQNLSSVLGIGNTTGGNAIVLTAGDPLTFNENATVPGGAPSAGEGKLWVRNDTPNVLVFTDDAGTDTVLGSGGGGAAVVPAVFLWVNSGTRSIGTSPSSPLYNARSFTEDNTVFDVTLNSSTDTIEVLKDGRYEISVTMCFYLSSGTGTEPLIQAYISINGSSQATLGGGVETRCNDSGHMSWDYTLDLDANDVVTVFSFLQSGAGGFYVEDKTTLQVKLLEEL